MGAAIGVAISVPLFSGIDDWPVQAVLMATFAGIMGYGQVLAGRNTTHAMRATKWGLAIGAISMFAAIAVYLIVS